MKFYKDVIIVGSEISYQEIENTNECDFNYARGRRGGGTTVVQNTREPWGGQAPYLRDIFAEAENIFTGGPQRQDRDRGPVDLSEETRLAQERIRQRATEGSPLVQAAKQNIAGLFSPNFIENNPAYQAVLKAKVEELVPQIQSQFAKGGSLRSGLAQEALQSATSRAAAKLALPILQMQQQARREIPGLAQQDYADMSRLAALGGTKEARAEAIRDARKKNLADYLAMIQGNYGYEQSQSTPYVGGSAIADAISGGLSGLGIAGRLGGLEELGGPIVGALGGLGALAGFL